MVSGTHPTPIENQKEGHMKKGDTIALQSRTEAKLRYADVHLKELIPMPHVGNDFERAHQESFLFHLFGALDSFLAELNTYYGFQLLPEKVTYNNIKIAIKKQNKSCPEIAALDILKDDEKCWLFHAKKMRDHSTHILGVPRTFHQGGPEHGKVFLRNPKTGENIEEHYVEAFKNWLSKMEVLLQKLRESAIKNNNP
jgi:hypothetical protein